MSDRRRFLKGLTSPWGREPPIRRPTALSRHIAQRQAGITITGLSQKPSRPLVRAPWLPTGKESTYNPRARLADRTRL